jgi:hypothetical protein
VRTVVTTMLLSMCVLTLFAGPAWAAAPLTLQVSTDQNCGSPAATTSATGSGAGTSQATFSFVEDHCYIAPWCTWPIGDAHCPAFWRCGNLTDFSQTAACLNQSGMCVPTMTSFTVGPSIQDGTDVIVLKWFDNTANCSRQAAGGITALSAFQHDYCFWSTNGPLSFWNWAPLQSLTTCGVQSWWFHTSQ